MLNRRIQSIILIIFLSVISVSVFQTKNVFSAQEQFDKFRGWTGLKGTKTGVFHVENINGRWWIITPQGNVFWSTGMYCVRITGIPETGTNKRPYKENSMAKYGNEREWARVTRLRLRKWGFNTIGDWSSSSIYIEPGFAYVKGLDLARDTYNVIPKGAYGYFPDVFSQEFRDAVYKKMEGTFKNNSYLVDDPKLLGYFLADEPSWYGSKQRRGSLVDDFIRLDPDKPGKIVWVNFLRDKYTDINALNSVWQTDFNSFDELLSVKDIKDNDNTKKDKLAFLKQIASEFSKVLVGTLKKFDPHHMVLGTRPTRLYPEVLEGLGENVDIFGLSHYGLNEGYKVSPDFDKTIDEIYKYAKKPIMLGVLITAKDTGLPYGKMKNQKDRGISYWRYLRKVASRPEIVGLHWFQYFDPPKNCYDKQAANWGIVNEKDEPYEDAVKLIAQANKMVYAYALGLSDFAPEFGSFFGNSQSGNTENAQEKELTEINIPVNDGGFEQGKRYWKLQSWKGSAKEEIDTSEKHTGKSSLKIQGREKGWDSVGVAMQYSPKIIIKPGYDYKISGWIKTKDVEDGASIRLKLKYNDGTSDVFAAEGAYGTEEWKYFEKKFSPRDENSVEYLGAHFVGQGTAWFDDIKLQVKASKEEASKLVMPGDSKEKQYKIRNLNLSNAGFEQGKKDWGLQRWKGRPKVDIDSGVSHSGKKSVKIKGSNKGWDSVGVAVHSDLKISFDPNKEYILGGWIKTKDVENSAFLRIKIKYSDGSQEYFQTEPLSGTGDWEKVSKEFQLKDNGQVDYFVAQMVGKGTAWFDDVFIGEIVE